MKDERKLRKMPRIEQIKVVGIFLVVGMFLGGFLAYAINFVSTLYIRGEIYPGAPSYTIWREGLYYYAKNAFGKIDHYGENASEIIEKALISLPAIDPIGGGTVLLKSGIYVLDTQVTIPADRSINLIGEKGAVLRAGSSNMVIIKISNNAKLYYPILVKGFFIDNGDNKTDVTAIDIVDNFDAIVEDCCIAGTFADKPMSVGIRVRTLSKWSEANQFRNIEMYWCTSGFDFQQSGSYSSFRDTYLENIFIDVHGGFGIRVNDNVDLVHSVWKNVRICIDASSSVGLWLDHDITASLIDISMESFELSPSGIYGIDIGENAVTDGLVMYALAPASGFTARINNPYSKNLGMWQDVWGMTQKTGVAEASNDDWISFGGTFIGTPQIILLTVQESDANYCAQVRTANATHFQLYLFDLTEGVFETAHKTISWYAEFRPY